jgi:hypothetical protein
MKLKISACGLRKVYLNDNAGLWIRIRIQRLCGSGSGSVLGIWISDPDPGVRKLRNASGKMHFLVIFNKNFTTKKV